MPSKSKIQSLCERLDERRRELIELEGDDPDDKKEYRRFPGAKAADISAWEKERGFPLSPQVKEFLAVNDGWLAAWPDWTLLGTPAAGHKAAHKEVAAYLKQLPLVADEQRRKDLVTQEKKGKKLMLITNHPVLGIDFNGSLLLADQNRVSGQEPEVVWVSHLVDVERRWKDFQAFLEDAVKDTEQQIKDLKKPAGKKKAKADEEEDWSDDIDMDDILAEVEAKAKAQAASKKK